MSKRHRRDPGPQVSSHVRRLLRQNRATVELELALQKREDDVRMTLPKIVWETYDEVPGSITVEYLPGAHTLVMDLPDAEPAVQLTDFIDE